MGYRRLQGIKRGYNRFHEVKGSYLGLQGGTEVYKVLKWVTRGYRRL